MIPSAISDLLPHPLVKPDATPEEVAAVVQGDQGAGGQVFAQAVRVISS
jgi:t-SNARE complex subunit (syntaxin)